MKEARYVLNTQRGGKAKIVTPKIKGRLLAVILSVNNQSEINIFFKDNPEISLFSQKDFVGTKYLPLKTDSMDGVGNMFNFRADHWYLNDELSINISGPLNTELSIVLRWDDG